MPGEDRGSRPFPYQAVLAGALAVLTVVLLTAMGGDRRARGGTAPGVIEASVGPAPTTSRPQVAVTSPPPLAAVMDGDAVPETAVAVPVLPPGSPALPAPGPATPTTPPASGRDTTPAPASEPSEAFGASPTAPETTTSTISTSTTTSTTSTTSTTVAARVTSGPVRTPGAESEVVPLTNADRTAQGLTALSRHACLDSAASRFAEQLATSGVLAHNPGAGSAVTSCRPGEAWGDNVGTAAPCSASLLEEKWMASASHRRNILTPAFRYIGVGAWTDAAGACWVQVLFSS